MVKASHLSHPDPERQVVQMGGVPGLMENPLPRGVVRTQ